MSRNVFGESLEDSISPSGGYVGIAGRGNAGSEIIRKLHGGRVREVYGVCTMCVSNVVLLLSTHRAAFPSLAQVDEATALRLV